MDKGSYKTIGSNIKRFLRVSFYLNKTGCVMKMLFSFQWLIVDIMCGILRRLSGHTQNLQFIMIAASNLAEFDLYHGLC